MSGNTITLRQFQAAINEEDRPQMGTIQRWALDGLFPGAHKLWHHWVLYPRLLKGWRFPSVGKPRRENA